jgi:hypothetical protein
MEFTGQAAVIAVNLASGPAAYAAPGADPKAFPALLTRAVSRGTDRGDWTTDR